MTALRLMTGQATRCVAQRSCALPTARSPFHEEEASSSARETFAGHLNVQRSRVGMKSTCEKLSIDVAFIKPLP